MPIGEDVAKYITTDEVVRCRAVVSVLPFVMVSGIKGLDRIDGLAGPLPPSGLEERYTSRFDNPTYY